MHAEALSSAAIINIVAESPNPVHAQEIAARATAAFLTDLRGNGVVIPRIYGQPTVPSKPAAPRTKLVLGVLVVLAVLLGPGAGLIWDRLFGRAESTGELPGTSRPPCSGSSPN